MVAVLDKDLEQLNEEVEKSLETNIKVQVKKEVLQNVIKRLDRSREKRGVVPIRQGIYLFFGKDELVGRAMNEDYSIEVRIPKIVNGKENYTMLSGEEGGAVFMDTKFTSMVNSMPRKNVKLSINGLEARLSAGRSSFEVLILDHLEYPNFMNQKEGVQFTLHPDILKRMYGKAAYATSSSEMRPVLMGVNHRLKGNKLTLVSTDAHRLATVHHELEEEVEETSKVVPATVIGEVQKQLDDTVSDVTVYLNETSAIYELDNGTTVFSRLIEGTYPDTDRLIPEEYQTEVQFRAEELRDLVKRALLVDQEKSPAPVKVLIKAEDAQVRFISREADKAGFVEDISPVNGSGNDLQLGFNIRYLSDALSHYPASATLRISFISDMRPFVIRTVGGSDEDLDLILPVRLAGEDLSGEVVIEDFRADYQSEMLDEEAAAIEE